MSTANLYYPPSPSTRSTRLTIFSSVYSVYSVVHISLRTLRPCASALKHLHLSTAIIFASFAFFAAANLHGYHSPPHPPLFIRPISRSTIHRYHIPCRNRPLRGFATRGEMRLRRSRQVGRGRRPSREAAARARANTPSVSECREVPAPARTAIEKAELEEIAEAEIGNGTEIKNHPIDTQFSNRSKKPVTHLNLRITSACENWKLGWREFAAYARRTRAAFATAGCEFLKSRMVCNNCS